MGYSLSSNSFYSLYVLLKLSRAARTNKDFPDPGGPSIDIILENSKFEKN